MNVSSHMRVSNVEAVQRYAVSFCFLKSLCVYRKGLRMCNNGGRNALSGYFFQTLYAIILCMKDENWNQIKVEPYTTKSKIDILLCTDLLYKDDICSNVDIHVSNNKGCYKKIQVKKRSGVVRPGELSQWVSQLKEDDPAEKYELCLFGRASDKALSFPEIRDHVKIYDNDIAITEKTAMDAIREYCRQLGAEGYSDQDLQYSYALLFLRLMQNSINDQPIKRDQINDALKDLLKYSVDNRAALLKEFSRTKFYQNPIYARDLSPARLDIDGQTLIPERDLPRLSKDEFPRVRHTINNTPENDKSKKLQFNLFDYFERHVRDESLTRHIYLSAKSGSGKTTLMYGLWEKYLDDDARYIPLYISLKDVTSLAESILNNYLFHVDEAIDFEWLNSTFNESHYHIILLLDGYNEIAVNTDSALNEKLKQEIETLLDNKKITVIVTSRNPNIVFEEIPLTNLTVCPLNREQIMAFTGGNNDNLPKVIFEGMLDNPFMLELCIKTFAGDKKRFKNINQVSISDVFTEHINRQTKGLRLSTEDKILINVILPLVTMKLDERTNAEDLNRIEEIYADPSVYHWCDFEFAVIKVQENSKKYKSIFSKYVDRLDKTDYVKEISSNPNAAKRLLDNGKLLEIFRPESESSITVIWDHEIYRDYFVARGYAVYCEYNKESEDCVYNLAKQINYRYPEPEIDKMNPRVESIIREYHLRKVQMFIDMVDERVSDDNEYNPKYLKKMTQTAVYRRLTRDAAFIYEDLDDIKMAQAAELSQKYYSEKLEDYNVRSDYDYPDRDRRYADAAYSFSGLGYNFLHDNIPEDKKDYYLEKACEALDHADHIFKNLEQARSKVLENFTVRDDRIKKQGNRAAYYFALSKKIKDEDKKKELYKAAKEIHEANRIERERLKESIRISHEDTSTIDNSIAQSYTGIATACYYLEQYRDAIANHEEALKLRPEFRRQEIFTTYRNIIGCYVKLKEYQGDDILKALKCIETTYHYANTNDIYKNYNELEKKYNEFRGKLTEEQKLSNKGLIERIEIERASLADKSYNSINIT